MKLKIALAQTDVLLGDPQENLEKAAAWVEQAASKNSDLILLPELWTTGYDLENRARHGVLTGNEALPAMAALAKKNKMYIGGSYLETRGEAAYNTFFLHAPDGEIAAKYRKLHLFRLMEEHTWLCPGEEMVSVVSPWGRSGLAVCYDLRFPELFRGYALEGAKIVFLVAEWPQKRIEHWRTLLRARAIENQMFIAAVNRVGESKGETFGGYSVILNPWGEPLVEGGETEELLTAEVDLSEVDRVREKIPVFQDRRPESYGAL